MRYVLWLLVLFLNVFLHGSSYEKFKSKFKENNSLINSYKQNYLINFYEKVFKVVENDFDELHIKYSLPLSGIKGKSLIIHGHNSVIEKSTLNELWVLGDNTDIERVCAKKLIIEGSGQRIKNSSFGEISIMNDSILNKIEVDNSDVIYGEINNTSFNSIYFLGKNLIIDGILKIPKIVNIKYDFDNKLGKSIIIDIIRAFVFEKSRFYSNALQLKNALEKGAKEESKEIEEFEIVEIKEEKEENVIYYSVKKEENFDFISKETKEIIEEFEEDFDIIIKKYTISRRYTLNKRNRLCTFLSFF